LRTTIALLAAGAATLLTANAFADPEYVRVDMSIDVNRPAAEVWGKVGGYCDISKWLNDVDCVISSGDGGLGTVRKLAGGRVTEILVGKTDLSYGYTQPAVEGRPDDLYHGYLEAKPVTDKTSKLVYSLVFDVSTRADQAAKDQSAANRRRTFEAALASMQALAEDD
jgi:Polyketide cyclase / dehydrase and lipid transport